MHLMIASVDLSSFFHAMSLFSHMFNHPMTVSGLGMSG